MARADADAESDVRQPGEPPWRDQLAAAVAALRAGDVIGLPTETVYGLAADASNPDAVRRIYAIKGRPATHPVIVHIADIDEVPRWAREFPPAARALAERYWPGPLTIVLPRTSSVPLEVTGGQDTVALRVPAHPVARAVLDEFGGGLAAPSANRYGRVSPTTAAHVREDLGAAVPIVLDGGPCDVGLESTIVACLDGRVSVLRPGRISAGDIASVVRTVEAPEATAPRVPGRLASHYAPRADLELVDPHDVPGVIRQHIAARHRISVLAPSAAAAEGPEIWIPAAPDADTYGRDLYANLRALDKAGVDVIVVARPPTGPDWVAIHDRLSRAASAR